MGDDFVRTPIEYDVRSSGLLLRNYVGRLAFGGANLTSRVTNAASIGQLSWLFPA